MCHKPLHMGPVSVHANLCPPSKAPTMGTRASELDRGAIESRLPGPISLIFFYIMWTAGYVFTVYLGWHQDALGQAGGGSALFWAMFWESLGPGIHVDINFTCHLPDTLLRTKYTPFMATVFPDGTGLYIMRPATLRKLFGNGLRNMMKSAWCCHGLQIPQISI